MISKIVLYGAGKRGRDVYNFLRANGWDYIVYCFCDVNAHNIKSIDGVRVVEPQELEGEDIIYCITLMDKDAREEIYQILGKDKCIDFNGLATILNQDKVKFNRDYIAYFHTDSMESYYVEAEKITDIFWGEESLFYKMFNKLNISNVIELACGRGRHVPKYLEKAGQITLVDILEKNIDYCKERFKGERKIYYYKNNGFNLEQLENEAYTAVFCYDAMVHFEMMDIYSYLVDIYRVLKKGGGVLLHHSNYSDDYTASFATAPIGRSFMSKKCFAYLAYRAGFEVIEQHVIDFDGVKDIDCITLLKKPE
jgi:ubiquinone/menaquinone biosynthesis C-methylase UbiE